MDSGADISVSCVPMDDSRATDFGLMKIDETGRIHQILEKPNGENLRMMKVDTIVLGLSSHEAKRFSYIASMGVYLFRTKVLLKILRWQYPSCNDFGLEIIPLAAEQYNVQVPEQSNLPKTCFLKDFKRKHVAFGHLNLDTPPKEDVYSIIVDEIFDRSAYLFEGDGKFEDVMLGDLINWPKVSVQFIRI